DIAFTSDIIVGFPGETYEDFKETLSLINEVKYNSLFTFIFSAREGTPAAIMDDPVSREEKGKWFNELLKTQEVIGNTKLEEICGSVQRVLCDEYLGDGVYSGRTDGMHIVHFESSDNLVGKLLNVKIDSYTNVLKGTVI
ncbi:MAG: tRNA (N6-isopentenyl adenosine(37)-C2)-methylthiotransferase MiaB, partial [Oscillospiraceae bacterium]|nr:tRNA (N6-isopentenyl adenosine(37)-C2)-methylthiotransferase MiaB [Oscillospiraceae bacterium]